MNDDFHYYATYYAAMLTKQFSEEQAKEIAWAAIMVDRLTMKKAAKYKAILGNNFIVTAQTPGEIFKHDTKIANNKFDCEQARGTRAIWVPFHFLPGHLDDEKSAKVLIPQKTEGFEDKVDISNYNKEYINACLKLRCGKPAGYGNPINNTVEEMLGYFRKAYAKAKENSNEHEALCAVGICMHVLADTFAHDDFSGVPCYAVNKVCLAAFKNWEYFPTTGEKTLKDLRWTEVNSVAWLGHGQMWHAPDYDFLRYEYIPRYALSCNTATLCEKPDIKERFNPDIFCNAFIEMYNALLYICGKDERYYRPSTNNVILEKAKDVKKILILLPDEEMDTDAIVKFKGRKWVEFLEDIEKENYKPDKLIIEKDVEKGAKDPLIENPARLLAFSKQAKLYRNFMLSKLDEILDRIYPNKTKPFSFTMEYNDEKWLHGEEHIKIPSIEIHSNAFDHPGFY